MRVIKEEREDGEYEAFRDKDQHVEEKPVLERVKEEREEKCEVENKQQELYNSLNTETSAGCVKTEKKETTEDDSVVTCVHCGEVLNNISFLQSQTHTEDHFTCHNCGKDFRGESHTDHLPNHTTAKKHQCPHCHKSFTWFSKLQRHMRSHTGEKPFSCSQCGKSFSCSRNLSVHMRIHTGEKPFFCSHCGKSFSRRGGLNIHMRTHTGEKPFCCSECEKSFSKKKYLDKHMKSHTEKKCEVDNKHQEFYNSKKEKQTEKSSSEETTEDNSVVTCVHCGEVLNNSNFLQSETRLEGHFTCHNCGKDFKAEGHKGHLSNHTTAKKHQCPHCHKSYDCSSKLKRHIRTHTKEKPFICSMCGKSFSCTRNLNDHMRIHSGEKPFICFHCGKSFSRSGCLYIHMKTHSGEKPFSCSQCGLCFSVKRTLDKHMRSHTVEKCEVENKQQELYNSLNTETSAGCVKTEKKETAEDDSVVTCVHCGEVLNNISFLQSETHTEDHFTCHNCGKDFRGESHTDHLPNHTTAKKHQCPHCHKSFAFPSDLKRHITTHTRKQPISCPQCGKCLKDQLTVHTDENNFTCHNCGKDFKGESHKKHQCPHCHKSFTSSSDLKRHIRTHTGEKPFSCSQCGKSFSCSRNLNDHMRIHTGEKPFICFHCGKRFSRSGGLHIHMRSHTGEKPFSCSQCGKSFSRKSVLDKHMSRRTEETCLHTKDFRGESHTDHLPNHTTAKKHQCPHCHKSFNYPSDLKRHIRTHW